MKRSGMICYCIPLLVCLVLLITAGTDPILIHERRSAVPTIFESEERVHAAGGSSRAANKVLVCTLGGDKTNTLQGHLTAQGIPFVVENPAATSQRSAEYLFDNYYAIYTGCQGDIADQSLKNMMNGGIIEKYVSKGGVFVANAAHNSGQDIIGPGGSNFGSYQQSGTTDENPIVSDNDHEWITGQGYGGNGLNANNFAGWGTTCHGYVTAPATLADSGGGNLGVDPETNKWNDILWSNANNKPALVEYVLDEGYVMMDMMTFDWGNRGNVELLQMVKYIEMIKDNFPTARPPEPESVNLLDENKTSSVCYTEYRPYTLSINVTTFESLNDLSDIRIYMDYNTTNITLGFNGTNKLFYKENDPDGHIQLLDDCSFSNDLVERWWINFSVVFNFTFPHEELVDCFINTTASSGRFNLDRFPYLFRVENDLELVGEPGVVGEHQGALERGNWIRGNENITFTNMTVMYENSPGIFPDDSYFDVSVMDGTGRKWWDNISSEEEVMIEILSRNVTDPGEEYIIAIENIPGTGMCKSNISFPLKIDSLPPAPPVNLICHADDFEDRETDHTNRPRMFVTWDPVEDNASGLSGYYYSLNDYPGTVNGTLVTYSQVLVENLSEGYAPVYVWCVDNVGNIGESAGSGILVDLSEPVFANLLPLDGSWHNRTEIECSAVIRDPEGSGVDGNSIEYSVSLYGENNFDMWIPAWLSEVNETLTPHVKYNFPEGTENYIKWRARDISGNDYVESPPVNIKVDVTSIEFGEELSPQPAWWNQREITSTIMVSDTGRGVDLDTLQYRTSVTGLGNFGSWMKIGRDDMIEKEGGNYEITVTAEFNEGKDNYMMFRGTDLVGNPMGNSKIFDLKIDTTQVYFGTFTPDETTASDELEVECFVTIMDDGSGVEPGTVEYSISTEGPDEKEFGEWKKPDNVIAGNPAQVLATLEFDWGTDNYIRWRADDVMGTGVNVSLPYRVWVNSKPVAFITSPGYGKDLDLGQEITLIFGQEIVLNGSDSLDLDGDNLSYFWTSSVAENRSLGTGPVIRERLVVGNHTITLHVSDGHGYNESTSVKVNVGEKPEEPGPGDNGGVGNILVKGGGGSFWLLFIIGAAFILLLLILAIALIIRRKRKEKKKNEISRSGSPTPLYAPRPSPYPQGQYLPGAPQGYSQPPVPVMNRQNPMLALPPGPQPGPAHAAQQNLLPGFPPYDQGQPQALPGGSGVIPGQSGGMNYLLPSFSTSEGDQNLNLMALPPGPELAGTGELTPGSSLGAIPPVGFPSVSQPQIQEGVDPQVSIQQAAPELVPSPGSPIQQISNAQNPASAPGSPIPMELNSPTQSELKAVPASGTPSPLEGAEAPPPIEGAGTPPDDTAFQELDSFLASVLDLDDTAPGAPAPPIAPPPVPPPLPMDQPQMNADAPETEIRSITMQCHSCGSNYTAEIPGLPTIVTCPHCQTQGMVESL